MVACVVTVTCQLTPAPEVAQCVWVIRAFLQRCIKLPSQTCSDITEAQYAELVENNKNQFAWGTPSIVNNCEKLECLNMSVSGFLGFGDLCSKRVC